VRESSVALVKRSDRSAPTNMVWILGGMFRMGSDRHYPEEATNRITDSP
jgi:formylglycine-generating enzyme required for sulfatase activity